MPVAPVEVTPQSMSRPLDRGPHCARIAVLAGHRGPPLTWLSNIADNIPERNASQGCVFPCPEAGVFCIYEMKCPNWFDENHRDMAKVRRQATPDNIVARHRQVPASFFVSVGILAMGSRAT